MEKRKAHFPLSSVKALIEQGAYRVTRTAIQNALRDFGFTSPAHVAGAVFRINSADFYKSMTTVHDHRVWQDVYRPVIGAKAAYLKVQIVDDMTVVISFKSLQED